MIVLGITGGTGAGKTSALRVLEELGVSLIDCDALYYEMLQAGTPLHTAIGEVFGQDMFDEAGQLNRQKLGALVFTQPEQLTKLNEIIYRHLGDEIARRVEECRRRTLRAVAVDGINMIQARQAGIFQCDCMVGVVAPDALRLQRIMKRDGIGADYAQKRIDAQPGNEFYLEHCDAVLENVYENQERFEEAAKIFFENVIHLYEKEKNDG